MTEAKAASIRKAIAGSVAHRKWCLERGILWRHVERYARKPVLRSVPMHVRRRCMDLMLGLTSEF